MKRQYLTKSITLGGIFAAIYMILTLLSIYVLSVLSVFGLIIMPIFAAYYASVYKVKETLIFNLSTLLICFICSISDPFFTLLYILPTLLIGDLFGLFNHLKIKYYATLFFQAIAYSLTNILTIYLAEIIYETNIISIIIPSTYLMEHFSLSILFILSGAEAVLSTMFVSEELAKLKIYKDKEKEINLSGLILIILLFLMMIVTTFFSMNVTNLLFLMIILLSFSSFYDVVKKIKRKELFMAFSLIVIISVCFYLSYVHLTRWLPLAIALPFVIIIIAKLCLCLYNLTNTKAKGGTTDV